MGVSFNVIVTKIKSIISLIRRHRMNYLLREIFFLSISVFFPYFLLFFCSFSMPVREDESACFCKLHNATLPLERFELSKF